jgi:pilus assembly protein CpaC
METLMTMQAIKHTDVYRRNSSHRRGGALMTAAGTAIAVLLLAGNATGADMMPATQPAATQPEMSGMMPTTAPSDMTVMNMPMPATAPATAPAESETASAPATQPAQLIASGLDKDGNLTLLPGRTAVITAAGPLKRVSVAQPDVADVKAISPTTILLTAKKAGSTELIVWDDDEHMQKVEVTVEVDLQVVRQQLKMMFPDSHVEATALGDAIALHGHVPSMQAAEQAVELVGAYTKSVHNFLEVYGGQQVMLQVRFAEVSKGAVRNLGVNFGGTDSVSAFTTTAFGGGTNTFNLSGPVTSAFTSVAGTATALYGNGKFGVTPFDYFIAALRENNLIRVLAEPNVLATSGQQASFLAGGEIPVPVPQPGSGGNTITIEYKDYGVQLNFIPLVLGNGKIRLKVAPEVSQLDYSTAVSIGGTSVPGFTDRKLDTTVELCDGQTLALAGLLNNTLNATVQEIPVLGQLPILGALFRSTAYQRNETELVVVVTPRLVGAMNPDQVSTLPGEHWRYPNDAQVFLNADLGGPVVGSHAGPPAQFHGTYGFSAAGAGNAMPQP